MHYTRLPILPWISVLWILLGLYLCRPMAAEEFRSTVKADAREVGVPGLSTITGPQKAPDPRGRGILVVGQGSQPDIYLVPWEGTPVLVEELRLPRGGVRGGISPQGADTGFRRGVHPRSEFRGRVAHCISAAGFSQRLFFRFSL